MDSALLADRPSTRSRFRAMASDVQLILVDPSPRALDHARERLRQLESRWSRFIADSELSQVVRGSGESVVVSGDTVVLVTAMRRAHLDTAGRYDPTMLSEIIDAGYGASIDDAGRLSVTIDLPGPAGSIEDVHVDATGSTVQLPAGLGLDPGGIGKGLAADVVVAELLAGGTAGALVSVGGDLVAAGLPPSEEGWLVEVEDPFEVGRALLTTVVEGGGVATSSTVSRRWSHRGSSAHHVLDPRSGLVARTDLATVTAMTGTGWEAEVHATAALVSGRDSAVEYLEDRGCSGVVVGTDGSIQLTRDLMAGPSDGAPA